jgi:hypothetical protein
MVSTKYFSAARLYLVLMIIFNHAIGLPFTPESNRISITDFKHFRKIEYKNQQLLLFKSSNVKSIYYLSDKFELDVLKKNNATDFNFKLDSKTTNYKITFSNNKSKIYSKQKGIFFDSAENSTCKKSLEENVLKIALKQYTRGINESTIASLTDETCDENQKQKLGTALRDTLLEEKSWLSKCYTNDAIKKLIENDTNYLKYSLSVYSKYLNLVKKLNDGQSAIKISCQVNSSGKLGSFDETTNPAKISFDWNNLVKKNGSDGDLNSNLKKTLGHELFHYGEQMQTPSYAKYDTCINESYAKLFTDFCFATENAKDLQNNGKSEADEIKNQKFPSSDQVAMSCKNNTKLSGIVSKDASLNTAIKTGEAGGSPLKAQQEQEKVDLAAKASQTLSNPTNPITQGDFTQPSDSDFAVLASNTTPNVQNGQPYTVPANSTFGQTVQKTLNSFNNSGNTLTSKLNSAVAATTNAAQAGTTTLATNTKMNTTGTTVNPTNMATNANNGTTTTTETNDTETSNTNTNSRMPAAVDNSGGGTGGKQSPGAGGPSEMAGGSGGGNSGGRSPAAINNKAGIPQTGGGGGDVSSGSGSGVSTTTTKNVGAQKQAEGAEMVKTIQSLKAFNTVAGGQYQEIKKHYNNPQFINLLQTYDMNIMVKTVNGQYQSIGVDRKKAKRAFNDDGQVLKTIEDKK